MTKKEVVCYTKLTKRSGWLH